MQVANASASPTQSSGDLLSAYDKTRLTPRYYAITGLLVIQEMFEYFDFFIAGYIVAVLAPLWKLTYGQSALILLNAGSAPLSAVSWPANWPTDGAASRCCSSGGNHRLCPNSSPRLRLASRQAGFTRTSIARAVDADQGYAPHNARAHHQNPATIPE
jgi:hypothetical protein